MVLIFAFFDDCDRDNQLRLIARLLVFNLLYSFPIDLRMFKNFSFEKCFFLLHQYNHCQASVTVTKTVTAIKSPVAEDYSR
ncbi:MULTISPECIES: hypothetical protein [Calothrix]|uniref:Transposase n=2 Tax=Calothrix TaxID=1186 RepID=A0ABR8AFZ0_9CYAN|nr:MULTISPECIES: hypothetical protein [Calothrix]MBD2198951.1 hypothetical protein [Calothrix parietina FACHB-288]MBD2227653.1 hypothetical protein [Calothrix anomala FACHB-343]